MVPEGKREEKEEREESEESESPVYDMEAKRKKDDYKKAVSEYQARHK